MFIAWKKPADFYVFTSEGPLNTFGCTCRVDENNTLIDNSEAGELVHNNSQWHPGFSALGSVPGVLPTATLPPTFQPAMQAEAATTPDEEPENEGDDVDEEDEEMDDDDNFNDAFDEDLDEGGAAIEEASVVDLNLQPPAPGGVSPNPLHHASEVPEFVSFQSNEDSTLSEEESDLLDLEEVVYAAIEEDLKALSPRLKKDIAWFSDTTQAKSCPSFVALPFNVLQTEERDIHMFRDIRFDADLKRPPPDSSHSQVLCQQALHQKMPPGFNNLAQMERLNMMTQIPELGVVVIGNQVGRVGILTMTRWEAQKQSGYKIECILPFNSEERKGMRPRWPLMGMAVGPVQGQETALTQESPRMGAQPPRRFRLLMLYSDHTILSYEISRPDGEENIVVV